MGTKSRSIFIDFEFNQIAEERVNLVCCATYAPSDEAQKERTFWLHNTSPAEKATLRNYLKQFDVIIGYACVAEARSFYSLGLNPLDFKWIDLFLEYRMLSNHNDGLNWGKQLVDGKVKTVKKPPPKWKRLEGEATDGFKPTHSLAEATYKLTGQIRNMAHKDKMRDLILSNPKEYDQKAKRDIMAYCLEDVIFLPSLWQKMEETFQKLDPSTSKSTYRLEALTRGRYSAHTALMESIGYPINLEATRNFSKQIPQILIECQRDINSQFPVIKPFRWNKKKANYTWDQKVTREWVKNNHDVNRWMKTDKGEVSLSLDAFQRFYSFQHSYPRGNFGAQIVRFLKLKQSLYGFSDSGGKRKSFWDSVGSDGRVRPYMNIYGAQSGRSQPAATGFMFLKPAWMRALVEPDKDHFLAGVDYGQQEFFVSALKSKCQNMIDAYLSGDPYLHTAKLCGAVPWDGKREDYKEIRDVFKNTTLGISYLMTKIGLSQKLTLDTGREWTEEDAQEQIDFFYEAYPELKYFQKDLERDYQSGDIHIRLECGWRMWRDNENARSVCNVPIQGFGASVMRKAVDLAVERGCRVIFTLHDAIYIEGKIGKEKDIAILCDAMRDAFQFYFKGTSYFEVAGKIKLDPFAWSPGYKADSEFKLKNDRGEIIKVPCSNLYLDERSTQEYEIFKKYFGTVDSDFL